MAIDRLRYPDLITMGSGLSGYCAIFYGFRGWLELAASFILLASILDGLDGIASRRYAKGELGKYLDSMSDLISFGVAPGILIYLVGPWKLIAGICAGIYLGAVMLRLARFCTLETKSEFRGLPSGCGGYLAGLGVIAGLPGEFILLGCMLLCALMLADYPHPKLEDPRILLGAGSIFGLLILSIWMGMELLWRPLAGLGLILLAIYLSLPLWRRR